MDVGQYRNSIHCTVYTIVLKLDILSFKTFLISTELAVYSLECPLHDNMNEEQVELDAVYGLSQLATDNITLPSYEEQSRSKKITDDASRLENGLSEKLKVF